MERTARGWWQVLRRAFAESSADNVSMLAGGVAFFAFLAVFPALIAALTLYGLIADPATVARRMEDLAAALPQQAQPLVTGRLQALAAPQGTALGIGLVVSVPAALWNASGGTGNLMAAVDLAYDEDETRRFVRLRGTALVLTLGAIVFVLLTPALVAVVVLLDALSLGVVGTVVVLMLWLYLTSYIVLLGAEINAESERQTGGTPHAGHRSRWVSDVRRPPTRWPRAEPDLHPGPPPACWSHQERDTQRDVGTTTAWETTGAATCS